MNITQMDMNYCFTIKNKGNGNKAKVYITSSILYYLTICILTYIKNV